MKKIYLILFACVAFLGTQATTYTVAASGTSFSPNTLSILVGDMVVFTGQAGGHPTAQVDATTWAANGTTPMGSGWGVKSANFTFTATTAGTIYYVCQNHVSLGMKGTITVNAVGINESTNNLLSFNLFPNPAQNDVKIGFSLNEATDVSVKMFNVLGQEVSVLTPSSSFAQGNYNLSYNLPATLSNGTYFVVVSANDKNLTKKLIINK